MPETYRLVNLCPPCVVKRLKSKPAHRTVETLLPEELKYCASCVNLERCKAFRDFGSDSS